LRSISIPALVLILLCIALVVTQTERYIHKGTILGYKVKNVSPSPKDTSNIFSTSQKPSAACDKVSEQFVSDALGQEVGRISVGFEDRTEPYFISSCSYRTKETPTRSVTINIRDTKDEQAAKAAIDNLEKRSQGTTVENVGDKAYYSDLSRQLTAQKGNRIVTVTVSKESGNGDVASKDAATKIAQQALAD